MLSLTAASGATTRQYTHSVADAGCAGSTEGVGAELDGAASAGRFGSADSGVDSGTSASSSTRSVANRTLFNARPVGAHTRPAAARRRAFPSSVFLSSPSTRVLCTATTDQCSATQAGIRRPMRHEISLLEVLLGTGSRFGSGGRASTGCLSNRCAAGLTSPPSSSRTSEFGWR